MVNPLVMRCKHNGYSQSEMQDRNVEKERKEMQRWKRVELMEDVPFYIGENFRLMQSESKWDPYLQFSDAKRENLYQQINSTLNFIILNFL